MPIRPLLALLAAAGLAAVVFAQTPQQQQCLDLYRQGEQLKKQKKTAEAIAAYEQAAALAPNVLGTDTVSTGNIYYNLAELYQSVGKLDKAAALMEQTLAIRRLRWGEDSPEAAVVMNNLAIVYKELRLFDKAEPLYRKYVEFAEAKYGPDHFEYGKALNNQAQFLEAVGRYDQVEPLLLKSTKVYEKARGPAHPDVAIPLGNLAQMYKFFGQYDRAEELARRALKLREAGLGPDHNDVATSLNNLAALLAERGQPERAGPLLRRAVEIWEKNLGPADTTVAIGWNNLATHYMDVGEYERAESLLRRTLGAAETAGPKNLNEALARDNFGFLYLRQHQPVRAEAEFRASLAIRDVRLGPNDVVVATTLSNLASAVSIQGKFAEALALDERAFRIKESVLGKNHPDVAGSLGAIASLYESLGRPAEATPLWERSLDIYRRSFGPAHPGAIDRVTTLATNQMILGRWDRAAEFIDQAQRLRQGQLRRVLGGLSEQEQLRFLSASATYTDFALSLGLVRAADPAAVARSAEWVLNGKGLAREVLAERTLLARDAARTDQADKIRALMAIRKQIANLTFAADTPANDRAKLDDLSNREADLARGLGTVLGRRFSNTPWTDLAAVRQALPADGVLVEFARIEVHDFREEIARRYRGAQYVAWVIPPAGRGDVRLVPLGAAKPIEDAVAAARRHLREAPTRVREVGEVDAERTARAALRDLARLIYDPIADLLAPARQWLICPDGDLWLVPWCALPVDDTAYAVERHSIRCVVSGRDEVKTLSPASANPALVLANPDFDLGVAAARTEVKQPAASNGSGLRSVGPVVRLPRVEALPATAAEAEAIRPQLAAWTGKEPRVLTDKQALESVVKAAARPRILVLSTHGFFLEDQRPDGAAPALDSTVAAAREAPQGNPLLRCGLLLAGCNNRGEGNGDGDDGVLTGLEVLEIDLRGSELVVLSACDTGVGVVHAGEGVAGLNQAFQLAGARAVLSTLWSIPDLPSAQLMVEFFTRLAAGSQPVAALQQAQTKMIGARRARFGTAHPLFWAAFTVTGN